MITYQHQRELIARHVVDQSGSRVEIQRVTSEL